LTIFIPILPPLAPYIRYAAPLRPIQTTLATRIFASNRKLFRLFGQSTGPAPKTIVRTRGCADPSPANGSCALGHFVWCERQSTFRKSVAHAPLPKSTGTPRGRSRGRGEIRTAGARPLSDGDASSGEQDGQRKASAASATRFGELGEVGEQTVGGQGNHADSSTTMRSAQTCTISPPYPR
jgi:hypothetical protein